MVDKNLKTLLLISAVSSTFLALFLNAIGILQLKDTEWLKSTLGMSAFALGLRVPNPPTNVNDPNAEEKKEDPKG